MAPRMTGGGGAPAALTVARNGDLVVVSRADGYRRIWRDTIAISEERGRPTVVAVGEPVGHLAGRAGSAEGRPGSRERRALCPEGFDPEVARAFLRYVVSVAVKPLPWWRKLLKPSLALVLPDYEQVPPALRLAFEEEIRGWGHPVGLNGRPPRSLSRRLDRTRTAAWGLAAVAFWLLLPWASEVNRLARVALALAVPASILAAWGMIETRWRRRILRTVARSPNA